MKLVSLFFITALISLPSLNVFASPAYIIILRHGEKINDKSRHLSPQGYQRADALAREFQSPRFQKQYGVPAGLFAASSKGGRSKRSIETLQPTEKALGLSIDDSYSKGDEKELIERIRKDHSLDDKTVIISWAHAGIPRLLREFDIVGNRPDEWDDDVFDHFWVLRNLPKGKWDFDEIDQSLLPGDDGYCAEKLQGRARNPRRPNPTEE